MPVRVFLSSKVEKKYDGIELISLPLIKIEKVPFNLEKRRFDYGVFTSKNGVRCFFSFLPEGTVSFGKVVAVGKATAKLLKELGYNPIFPENYSGEGLIELFRAKDLKGKTFLVIRPEKGRTVFLEFLKKKGAEVKEVIVYRTVGNEEVVPLLKREIDKGFEFLCFTSPSNFKYFLKYSGGKGEELLKKGKVIPIGHVTKEFIESKGFKVYKMPKEYTVEGILELVKSEVENGYR